MDPGKCVDVTVPTGFEVSEILTGTVVNDEFAVNTLTRYRRYRPGTGISPPLATAVHADQVLSGVGVSPVLTSRTSVAPDGRLAVVQETDFQVVPWPAS